MSLSVHREESQGRAPDVGERVHYVNLNDRGVQACRTALVTEVSGTGQPSLAVFNTAGLFFCQQVPYDGGQEDPPIPMTAYDGVPTSQCTGRWHLTGSWHWAFPTVI